MQQQPVLRPAGRFLNRNLIIVVVAALMVMVLYSVVQGFAAQRQKASRPQEVQVATSTGILQQFPSSYDRIPRPVATQQPVEIRARMSERKVEAAPPSELERLRARLALQALQADLVMDVRSAGRAGLPSTEVQPVAQNAVQQNGLSIGVSLGASGGGPEVLNPRDGSSRQDEKEQFLSKARDPSFEHSFGLEPAGSPYTMMAGTIIPGVLISGINSDLPGQILGQVSENIFDTKLGRHLLVPQGTKVIGQYDSRVVYGQDRVLVVWTRLGFPNGTALSLDGMPGMDMSGYAGLKDKVNHHFLRLLTGVVLGSMLGAGAQIAQGDTGTLDPSFSQLALQGAAQNINQAGQRITEKNLDIQPTIEIRPGHRFSVFVTKDVVLKPYRE